MATKTQRPQGRDDVLSSLNMAIDALNLAKEATRVLPAKAMFTSSAVLLAIIRVGSSRPELVDCWLTYTGLNDQQSGLRRIGVNLC